MMDQGKLREEMAGENIREREKTFKSITNSVFDSIILVNDMGEISFWSRASERIMERSSR
ncbi:MAG: hypothetical protein WC647_19365 [Desulfomonilaceae bacterium]|jgi:hypothetical protein